MLDEVLNCRDKEMTELVTKLQSEVRRDVYIRAIDQTIHFSYTPLHSST